MKILYIAGRGHSGTTALDIALGSNPEFVSCGEISSGVGRHPLGACSCGKHTDECSFWASILSHVTELEAAIIKNSDKPYNILNALFNKPDETYKNITVQIFEKLSDSHSIIIDSSKEMSRAIRLFKIFGSSNYFCIYLIRDPRSILSSYLSRYNKLGTINLLRKKRKIRSTLLLTILVLLGLIYGYSSLLILKILIGKHCLIVNYDSLSDNKLRGLNVKIKTAMNFDESQLKKYSFLAHPIAGNKILTEQKKTDFKIKRYQDDLKVWQLILLSPVLIMYRSVKTFAF